MEFDKADEYRDGRGAARDEEFNDLWAACPINGAFYLEKSLNKYNTILSKASRYGKVLGCKFKVRDLGEQLKVSKYSLDIEKELRKKRQEETPRLKHDDIREYNIEEQRERELQANDWKEPVKSLGQTWLKNGEEFDNSNKIEFNVNNWEEKLSTNLGKMAERNAQSNDLMFDATKHQPKQDE